jgi:DNA-3-methyladenine glycosylase I
MAKRCDWVGQNELIIRYHDEEWGVPIHDDRRLFEFLILEGIQAGLSWLTILKKRENYREALDHFDPRTIAEYDREKVDALLQEPGIVRNRLKIDAAVVNARAFIDVQQEFGSFDRYIWRFVDGTPIRNEWRSLGEIPSQTCDSVSMSRT